MSSESCLTQKKALALRPLDSKRTTNNALAVQFSGQAQEIPDKRAWYGITRAA